MLHIATTVQLAGDGENDKGTFLGHNGLSPTLAEQRERERGERGEREREREREKLE